MTIISSTSTTPGSSNYDRPNRLKGREDGIIRWSDLLDKFRSVQEKARRAQRLSGDAEEGNQLNLNALRLSDGLDTRMSKLPPPVPVKDPTPTPLPAPKKTGLGRQFGRLGGAVSGRGKRTS